MPQMAQAKRRVKVYSYNEDLQWVDKGTGYVMCSYVDRLMALAIVVRSEGDGSVILESKITPDHPYQKQEDTLIVWTESDSCDLALSFQHQAGCDEVWTKICETLGQYSNIDMGQDIEDTLIEEFEGIGTPIDLPPCELSKLEEIAKIVKCPLSTPMQRESRVQRECLVQAIKQQDYVPKLIELFHMCEDLGNLEGLYHLYEIFRTFFALNRETLLQLMLHSSLIMDVIGCLEYNPSSKNRVHHREYIQSKALFKEIIPFEDKEMVGKIHHLYKVIYIQEVILPTPSLFEENLMSALNLSIMYYKSEIVSTIQEDETFLTQLFTQLCDEATDESRLIELARLLKEICNFAQSVKSKEMYQVMKQHGLMSSIESMLMSEVAMVISYAVDILMIMMEFDVSMVKDYIIQQQHQSSGQDDDNQLLLIIVDQLVDSINSDCDVQLVGLIKMLIVPEPIVMPSDPTVDGTTTATTTTSSMEKSFFLQNFYKHCMHKLIAPLMAQTTGDSITKDTPSNAILLSHILDILSFCVESHNYHIKNYILNKNLLARVLVLMKSVHSHLALAALRFCRRIVGLKDEQYCRYIIKNNLFDPIVKAFEANGCRYNLLNSAIIELFEYIRYEDIKLLVEYFVDKFSGLIDSVDYVSTFKNLMLRREQELDRIENGESEQQSQAPQGIIHGVDRYRPDPHAIDEEEEKWFNDEEESTIIFTTPSEKNVNSIPSALLSTTPPDSLPGAPSMTTSFFSPTESSDVPFLHPTTPFGTFPSFVGSPRPPIKIKPINIEQKLSVSPALQSLVEYNDEDSDEEEISQQETASPAKKQRLEVSLET